MNEGGKPRILSPNQIKILKHTMMQEEGYFYEYMHTLGYDIDNWQHFKNMTYIIAECVRDGLLKMQESKHGFKYTVTPYAKAQMEGII